MAKSDYFVSFWNQDNYAVQESSRSSGEYSTQWCEVEMRLDGERPDKQNYEMKMGVRFYADNDATSFVTTEEAEFDWYDEEMEFSNELKEEPVYEEPQTKKQAEEVFEITVEDVFAAFLEAYNAYLE